MELFKEQEKVSKMGEVFSAYVCYIYFVDSFPHAERAKLARV
jgi:hypothetical protein